MIRFIVSFLATALLALPAQAQALCGNRTDVLGKLANGYSENATAMGLSSNGGVVEVLTSPKGNTWTIIITMPNGVSCLIAAGESWESLPQLTSSNASGA